MFVVAALLGNLLSSADELPPPRLVGEAVELRTDTGTLYGTLDLPSTPAPWPVVLIHPGSGPTDRDGNSRLSPFQTLRNDSLKLLGRGLAKRGIAALRIDKRGIAASAKAIGNVRDLRVETYADDAASWLAMLRRDRRFGRVCVIGHSEGALIGLMAAKKARINGMICLCGLGRPLQDVLRTQLKPALSPELFDAAEKIIVELAAGREVPDRDVPATLKALFPANVQPYLISEFRLDPARLAAGLDLPLLVVNGTADIQVPVEDGKRLAEAKPGTKQVVLKGMNHVLKETDRMGRLEQLPIYNDPSLPLHPALLDVLKVFLREK
jgi:pimeloyl-ACP methyl ester carboxylesterase